MEARFRDSLTPPKPVTRIKSSLVFQESLRYGTSALPSSTRDRSSDLLSRPRKFAAANIFRSAASRRDFADAPHRAVRYLLGRSAARNDLQRVRFYETTTSPEIATAMIDGCDCRSRIQYTCALVQTDEGRGT